MAFKKTADGRVFFQNAPGASEQTLDHNLEEPTEVVKTKPDSKAAAKSAKQKSVGKAKKKAPISNTNTRRPLSEENFDAKLDYPNGNGGQTQFQILTLLKTLNVRLKNTQDERNVMQKQLSRYERVIGSLEDKALKAEMAHEKLSKTFQVNDLKSVQKTEHAEKLVGDATKDLKDTKRLIAELQKKVEKAEVEVKAQSDARIKIETDIAARQAELEELNKAHQLKLVDYALTNKNLTKRLNKAEIMQGLLDERVSDAAGQYDALDRRIEKALQDRTRMINKVERIEEAVLQTRDALNAKAMVLLTDQNTVAGTDLSVEEVGSLDDTQVSAIKKAQQDAVRDVALPWWQRPFRLNILTTTSIVALALLAGWGISQIRAPEDSLFVALPSFSDLVSPGVETSSYEPAFEASADRSDLAYYTDQTAIDAGFEAFGTRESDFIPAETLSAPIPVQEAHNQKLQDVVNDIGALDVNDEAALVAALEDNPKAVAQRLNEIEPSVRAPVVAPASISAAPAVAPTQAAPVSSVNVDAVDFPPSLFAKSPEKYSKPDRGLPNAVRDIEAKALAGNADAQHDLAAIYTAGHGGVKQNYDRAAFWFDKSVRGGVANAGYNLGVMHHQGLGLGQDLSSAIAWYKAAASLNHPEAQYNLAIAYIEGIGVNYDPAKASAYFEGAAQNGVVEAAYNLGLIHENGLLGKAEPEKALAWYKVAADRGNKEAETAFAQLSSSLGLGSKDANRLAESSL